MKTPVRNSGSDNLAGTVLAVIFLVPLLFILSAALLAWPVMLFIGNASIASGGLIPAIGYKTTFWLSAAIIVLTSPSRASTS